MLGVGSSTRPPVGFRRLSFIAALRGAGIAGVHPPHYGLEIGDQVIVGDFIRALPTEIPNGIISPFPHVMPWGDDSRDNPVTIMNEREPHEIFQWRAGASNLPLRIRKRGGAEENLR